MNDESIEVIGEYEKALSDIESVSELLYKLDSQFETYKEFGIDRTDYFKVYCIKFLGMKESDFFDKWYDYINDDTRDQFYGIIQEFTSRLRSLLGVIINLDSIEAVELTYQTYKLFIVNPQQYIIDFLLYNHFYVPENNFSTWYNKLKTDKKIIVDIFEDPVAQYDKTQTAINRIAQKEGLYIEYKDRVEYFIQYARNILTNVDSYELEEIFDKLNIINPNSDYEYLDKCATVKFDLSFEDKELFIIRLLDRTIDTTYLLSYLIEEIINPFFKFLDTFIQTELLAVSDSVLVQ